MRTTKWIIGIVIFILGFICIEQIVEIHLFLSKNESEHSDKNNYNYATQLYEKGGFFANKIGFIASGIESIGINKKKNKKKLYDWLNSYEKNKLLNLLRKDNYELARNYISKTKYSSGKDIVEIFKPYENINFEKLKNDFIVCKLASNYNTRQSYVPESKYIQKHEYLFMDTYYTIESVGGYNETYVSSTNNRLEVTNKFIAISISGSVYFKAQRIKTSFAQSINALFTFSSPDRLITETYHIGVDKVNPHQVFLKNKTVGYDNDGLFAGRSGKLKNVRLSSKSWEIDESSLMSDKLLEQNLWQTCTINNNKETFLKYLEKYPNGKHFLKAISSIDFKEDYQSRELLDRIFDINMEKENYSNAKKTLNVLETIEPYKRNYNSPYFYKKLSEINLYENELNKCFKNANLYIQESKKVGIIDGETISPIIACYLKNDEYEKAESFIYNNRNELTYIPILTEHWSLDLKNNLKKYSNRINFQESDYKKFNIFLDSIVKMEKTNKK